MHEDRFVESHDGIRIAVRDHHPDRSGAVPDVVLLHGAGSHLLSLTNLVRKLGDGVRVVAMDARWSGQSGGSDAYDWGDLVGDVESVIGDLGLDRPVVAGHSWGGMIAAYYGAAHPDATGVVNLDGHGVGNASLFDGLTEEEYQRGMAMLRSANDPWAGQPVEGDRAWRDATRDTVRAMSEAMGVPAARLDEFADRSFLEVGPGRWRRQPSPTLMSGLQDDLDLFSLYGRVECPLQIFNCRGPLVGPAELEALMAAYRRGLTRALGELARERPNVDVVVLDDTDHNGVLAGGAAAAAAEMRRFIDAIT